MTDNTKPVQDKKQGEQKTNEKSTPNKTNTTS